MSEQQILINAASELRSWLEAHHQQKDSVWLVRWKKNSEGSYVAYDDVVDQLLCFGWVDSVPRKLNEHQSMLRISPRNPKSNWSRVNKERVEKLISMKRMHSSGIEIVELAKRNGTWNFLDDVEALIIPEDLKIALNKVEKASFYFDRFPRSSKRGILEWIKSARTEQTRLKRILETVEKASLNMKANHPKVRDAGPSF